MGKSITLLIPADRHDEEPEILERIGRGERIDHYETVRLRKDGSLIDISLSVSPIKDADGKVIGASKIARDISERKRAEQIKQRLAAIVESSYDAIQQGHQRDYPELERGAKRLFGYSADEVIGKSVTLLIPAERHDEEPKILERIRRGEPIENYETVRLRKDGSLIDISLSVSPIKDAGGKVIGASKIARDITERKQAQARQEMLTRELHHRTKNLFAVVQSVVSRSFTGKHTVKDAETAVKNRLRSLAQTHALLVEKDWPGADLAAVVRTEMSPYPDRVTVDGPTLMLSSQAAQNFALAVHELRPTLPSMGRYRTRPDGFTLAGLCSKRTAIANSTSVGRSLADHQSSPRPPKGSVP